MYAKIDLYKERKPEMKKLLSIMTAALLLICAVAVNVSAASVADFTDMPDDWSTPALTAAVENGLLNGSDGLILPKDNLTRAQMAAIIARAFGADSKASLDGFTDVPETAWYYGDMQKAVAMGVFNGDGSGLLTPDNNITREQVFAVLARAFKLPSGDISVLDKFSDKDSISEWAKPYAAALVGNGYISGSGGMINAKNNITRAEFAQVMYNMAKTYVDESTTLDGTYAGNVIVRASDVTIAKTAKIDGILVIAEGCTNVVIETGATVDSIINNTITTPSTPSNPSTPDAGDNNESVNNKPDDIYWIRKDTETSEDNTSEDDDEGWTDGIYRP